MEHQNNDPTEEPEGNPVKTVYVPRKLKIRSVVNDLTNLDPEKLIYGCSYPYLYAKTRNAYRVALLQKIKKSGTQRPDDLHDNQITIDEHLFECFEDRENFRNHFIHIALNNLDQGKLRDTELSFENLNNISRNSNVFVCESRRRGRKRQSSSSESIQPKLLSIQSIDTQEHPSKLPVSNKENISVVENCLPKPPEPLVDLQVSDEDSVSFIESSSKPLQPSVSLRANNKNSVFVLESPAKPLKIRITAQNSAKANTSVGKRKPKPRNANRRPWTTKKPVQTFIPSKTVQNQKISQPTNFFDVTPTITVPSRLYFNPPNIRLVTKGLPKPEPELPSWLEFADVFARFTPFGWRVFLYRTKNDQTLKVNHYSLDDKQMNRLKWGDRIIKFDSKMKIDKYTQIELFTDDNNDLEDEDYEDSDGIDFFLAIPQIMNSVLNSSNDWKIFENGPKLIDELMDKDEETIETYHLQLQEYYQDQQKVYQYKKNKPKRPFVNSNFEEIQSQIEKQKALIVEQIERAKLAVPVEPVTKVHPKKGKKDQSKQIGSSSKIQDSIASSSETNNSIASSSETIDELIKMMQSQPSTSKNPPMIVLPNKSTDLAKKQPDLKRKLSPTYNPAMAKVPKILQSPPKIVVKKLPKTNLKKSPEIAKTIPPNGMKMSPIASTSANTYDNRALLIDVDNDNDEDDDVQFIPNPVIQSGTQVSLESKG